MKDKELVGIFVYHVFITVSMSKLENPSQQSARQMLPSAAHLRAEPRAGAWVGWGAVASAAAAKTWQKVNWSIIEILYLVNV